MIDHVPNQCCQLTFEDVKQTLEDKRGEIAADLSHIFHQTAPTPFILQQITFEASKTPENLLITL